MVRVVGKKGAISELFRSYRGRDLRRATGKAVTEAGDHRDPDVHAQVVAAAAEEGVSVSAWMTNAARRALLVRDGLKAVEEWEAEHGALSGTEWLTPAGASLRSSGS